MRTRSLVVVLSSAIALAIVFAGVANGVPNDLNFQGRLLDSSDVPVTGPVDMEVAIFDQLVGGTALYSEQHLGVALRDGVFSIIIGNGSSPFGTLDPTTFSGMNAYLEVSVDSEILTPRQPFNSSAYSLQSEVAADADTVDGFEGVDLDQSAHVADTGNPHSVTAAQAGAASQSDIDSSIATHAGDSAAHHVKTSAFTELSGQINDAQVPALITRDTELNSGLALKANLSHSHNAADVTSGTLSTSRFDAYNDLSVSGRLDNNSSVDLLTRTQADGRFVNVGEPISASSITSGTLSTSRYDAYSDLSVSGRLDNNASSDLLTRSQADGRYGIVTSSLNANCPPSSVSFTTAYTKIADIGSFTKLSSTSAIEATFHGRLFVSTLTSTGALFELRIDNSATANGRARGLVRSSETGGVGVAASMSGIFTGYSSGTRTVSLWVRAFSGTGTGAQWDPGCFTADHVVVKELP